MSEQDRREERQEKRLVKRLGGKLRRRVLKRNLAERPEDAPHDEVSFGKLSSAPWNGRDRRPGPGKGPDADDRD